MIEPLNIRDILKTRHFISFEQNDEPQKIEVGEEKNIHFVAEDQNFFKEAF